MRNRDVAPKGFKFVSYPGYLLEPDKHRFSVRCKKCGHDCTQFHHKKEDALKEFIKRGHSQDMCKWFRKHPNG